MKTRWIQRGLGLAACIVACTVAAGCEKKTGDQAAVEPLDTAAAKKAPAKAATKPATKPADAAKAGEAAKPSRGRPTPPTRPVVTAEQLARNPAPAAAPTAGAQAAQAIGAVPNPAKNPLAAAAVAPPTAAPVVPTAVGADKAEEKPADPTAKAGGVVTDAARRTGDPAPATALPARGTAPSPDELNLEVSGYISVADLERVLGAKQKLRRADLPGIAASPRYNSLYYAPDKGDGFGVGVQVWRDENLAESRTRFNTMRNTWSNVAPTNKVTEQGFRSYFGTLVSVVFADPRRPLVAAVSCATKICDADMLIELSKRVAERLR
jgi:hypothetical protein